ncbi:PET112-like (Yeast), related [Eimeria brunetti]|uniref:PET112-like (Yeast), related n=1 Tax=Eimeria brunetti TaxID=51314 RepID=U6LY70_9EIME|nr:PET112-like (Yeast), related [Eimeria brunetti]
MPRRGCLQQRRTALCSSSSSGSSSRGSSSSNTATEAPSFAEDQLQLLVGIEAHVQLATSSKAFCCCPAYADSAAAAAAGEQQQQREEPPSSLPWLEQQQQKQQQQQQQQQQEAFDSRVCPTCLGDGGAPPSPNRRAIELALAAAMLMHCNTADVLQFDRKCYVYPDLAKRYQITQTFSPIGYSGFVEIVGEKRIKIKKVQLEEDTAKTNNKADGAAELNNNRAGTPLIEVVTEAEPLSAAEAASFAHELFVDLRNAGICEGLMASGRFRCDLNLSLRCLRSGFDYPRVEVKNVRSIKAIRRAVEAEERRQKETLKRRHFIQPETRHWDDTLKAKPPMDAAAAATTEAAAARTAAAAAAAAAAGGVVVLFVLLQRSVPLRGKVNSSFVYFPFEETQIPPVALDKETKEKIKKGLVPPAASRRRLYEKWGLAETLRKTLAKDIPMSGFFEDLVSLGCPPPFTAAFLVGGLKAALRGVCPLVPLSAQTLAPALRLASAGALTNKALRLYVAALARGDPEAKTLLTDNV